MAANRISFTRAALDKATCTTGAKRAYLYDIKTPGLLLMLTSNGAKSFYLYRWVNGSPRRVRIGGYPDLSIEQARTLAAKLNGKIAEGIDPRTEKLRARGAMTLAELFAHYLNTHAKQHARTWADYSEQFNRYFGKPPAERTPDDKPAPFAAWRNRRVSTVAIEDIRALHAKIGKDAPYAANRLLSLLSAMFNHAGLANPTDGVKRFAEHKRARFLHPDELPRFFAALAKEPNPTIRDFILVCILAGARRSNTQAMRWDEVNLERATWTIPLTKSGEPAIVHLAPAAVRVLTHRWNNRDGSPFVFPGSGRTGHLMDPKAAWKNILTTAGLTDLRLHDLRRTLGSWQAAGGTSMLVIGKSLGHKDGSPATAIYARMNLDPVKQSVNAATAAIGQHMPAGLLEDATKAAKG